MKDRVGSTESPCYTIINQPSDVEQPSEVQLRTDLGKRPPSVQFLLARLVY